MVCKCCEERIYELCRNRGEIWPRNGVEFKDAENNKRYPPPVFAPF